MRIRILRINCQAAHFIMIPREYFSKDFNITEEESTGVLQRLIEGKDLTLYGLSNAVTRFSQDVDSYDRATALEGIGYNILSMPRQQWNRINQMVA